MDNSSDPLPLGRGIEAQKTYISKTLDLIEQASGAQPQGWSSPSVYANGDTFAAVAAEGIAFTLDSMDSDVLSELSTPSGPLLLMPYPVVTVDMGQNLARTKTPEEIERLLTDYILELAREARADPERDATVAAIGIHPFVVGMPDGAAALRRVLEKVAADDLVWLTDVQAVFDAAGGRPWQEREMRFAVPFACALAVLNGALNPALGKSPVRSEKTITLAAALHIAQLALDKSHADGASHVAIVVVDNAARTLVALRDDHATEHPLLAAGRKAWTAANYGSSTKDVLARIEAAKGDDGQLVHTTESLFLMGGVPIKDGEEVVGAIGVAGNLSGFEDDAVAMTAAAAFQQLLSANPR